MSPGRAGRREAASSVAPISQWIWALPASLPRTAQRTPSTGDHPEPSSHPPVGSSNPGVEKAERDLIMRQGVVLPETPRQRRDRAGLEEDLQTIALTGKPLPIRARHFRPTADAYLVATRGPLPYMLRLREIEQHTAEHESSLSATWVDLAEECADDADRFRREWLDVARRHVFDEVNDLIDRHNRWYPAESRLPMDPRRGDYALVNGRDYRLEPLDTKWVLERFPADLATAEL
jgi:hypothetical protein